MIGLLGQQKQVHSVRVFALHKSGTMFLHRFFGEICRRRRFDYFSANNDPPDEQRGAMDFSGRFCVCPIRSFDELGAEIPDQHRACRIIQVRDPRDMLVSEYFSFGWSHSGQRGEITPDRQQEIRSMSVDDYVLAQSSISNWPLEHKFEPLMDQLDSNPDFMTIVLKYETMVTDFRNWAQAAIQPFCSWNSPLLLRRVLRKYRHEFVPTGDRTRHKRAVFPGDHRAKLKPATIDRLNNRFAPVLEKFGYPL